MTTKPNRPAQTSVSPNEARRRHKKKARRTMLRRLVILLILVGGWFLLWKNWDTLAPDKLVARFQDSMNDRGDGFPVDLSGTEPRRLVRCQNYSALLTDSHLIFYDDTGGEVTRTACTYVDPLVRCDGKYILLAEQGGKRAQLVTRSTAPMAVRTEQNILAAAVNAKGQFALLTQGGQGYAVTVTVYDRKGEILYSRSRGNLATEVALAPDGKELALLSVSAADGTLSTAIEQFSLRSEETQAEHAYTAADVLLYRLQYGDGHRLMAVGEENVYRLDGLVTQPIEQELAGKRVLAFASADDGSTALAVRPYGDTGGGDLLVVDKAGKIRSTVPFTGELRDLTAAGNRYLLLTDTAAVSFSASGAVKQADVSADSRQAVLTGNKAVVLGLSTLQIYALE